MDLTEAEDTKKRWQEYTGVVRCSWYLMEKGQFSSVQLLSRVRLCEPTDCSTPGLPVHHQLPGFTQTHVHWVGNAIQPSHPLSPPFPPALNLSQNQDFSNELALCIKWTKYWSFSFSINPFIEYSGLISFRMDWLDLLAVKRLSRVFSNTTVQKHKSFAAPLSL